MRIIPYQSKKTTAKSPEKLISKISPISQEKFLLNNPSQKSNQLKISQSLPLTANQEQKPTERELILLQKIKYLEEQLKKTTIERDNLKQLVQQEKELSAKQKQRADNYQQQLKAIAKVLKQLQKINYYQQLEQEQKAQVEQSPPWKPPNK